VEQAGEVVEMGFTAAASPALIRDGKYAAVIMPRMLG
jgi:hypothetical protein